MARLVSVILVLVYQIGLSKQTCRECECCRDVTHNCDSNKNCLDGCIDGYYGSKCTAECLENCKTCVNGFGCTKCKPGYYTAKCNLPCGKGCVNNTCSLVSGDCSCKSTEFVKGKCDVCVGLKYGDECNNTCPNNCGTCTLDPKCSWCKKTVYYGSYCQHRCSVGCDGGRCRKIDGYCLRGCKPGYIGDKCDPCVPGVYGSNCDLSCPENCYECFSASNCTVCKTGFYGETCTNTCSSAILPDRDGILIGSIVGSFLAGGIVVGVIALVAFKVWKRRNGNNKETNTHGYENTQVADEYRSNGTNGFSIFQTEDTHNSDSPVTYEDLKSRDDRLYSELSTSQQLSPPAADYVNSS